MKKMSESTDNSLYFVTPELYDLTCRLKQMTLQSIWLSQLSDECNVIKGLFSSKIWWFGGISRSSQVNVHISPLLLIFIIFFISLQSPENPLFKFFYLWDSVWFALTMSRMCNSSLNSQHNLQSPV